MLKKSNIILFKTFRILCLASLTLSLLACSHSSDEHHADPKHINISGIWEYEQITAINKATNNTDGADQNQTNFKTSHFHVGISDDGEQVVLDNCQEGKDVVFTRSNHYLINQKGEKLHIVDESTIESISVEDMRKLVRTSSKSEHFHEAGTVTLQSNQLATTVAVNHVCAQRIKEQDSNNLKLILSIPFETSFMEIVLEVSDIDKTPYNIDNMTFSSPALFRYYNRKQVESLYGSIVVHALNEEHVELDFDVTSKQFSVFPGDQFQGSIDVHL